MFRALCSFVYSILPILARRHQVLYVGVTTGLCGSVTTFSLWMLEVNQVLIHWASNGTYSCLFMLVLTPMHIVVVVLRCQWVGLHAFDGVEDGLPSTALFRILSWLTLILVGISLYVAALLFGRNCSTEFLFPYYLSFFPHSFFRMEPCGSNPIHSCDCATAGSCSTVARSGTAAGHDNVSAEMTRKEEEEAWDSAQTTHRALTLLCILSAPLFIITPGAVGRLEYMFVCIFAPIGMFLFLVQVHVH